ncbi:ABC transporter substrate-binding protein [Microbacterium sp.]|uniref:ABC transporter substrate-binding protein n=1 Tax=Microbacterium sp. TaxID=51671 RepID=UPI003C74EBFE
MHKKAMLATLAVAAVLALPACSGADPLSTGAGGNGSAGDTTKIIVGSADFSESQLLATIYSHALKDAGVDVEEKLNIGSREVYMQALKDGSINLLPEYNGYLLGELDPKTTETDRDVIQQQLKDKLNPEGIEVLDPAEAENTDVLVVGADVAKKHDLVKISDLAPVADQLVLAGPAEWKTRQIGLPGLEQVYGLKFKEFKVLDAGGPLTLSALQNGQAQVGDMFSSDPAIKEGGFVSLVDDKGLFLPANVLPVIRKEVASDKVKKVLDQISAALTTTDLMTMNGRIADGDDIQTIADDWIAKHIK